MLPSGEVESGVGILFGFPGSPAKKGIHQKRCSSRAPSSVWFPAETAMKRVKWSDKRA